jgi:hypothetical protein
MKFNEAMEELQKGSKVTRQSWVGAIYFKMDGKDVKTYQPHLINFLYNEDIMVSDGWIVEGIDGEHKFYDIISFLQQNKKAWIKDWVEKYIYLDQQTKNLVVHSMDVYEFTPGFDAFVAQDWVVLS